VSVEPNGGRGGPRKLLMVAYYFPPVSTSGSMRPLSFLKHLPRYGWSASVIACAPESVLPPLPVDAALAHQIPAEVEVVRVGHDDPIGALLKLRDAMRGKPRNAPAAGGPGGTHTIPTPASSWQKLKDAIQEHAFAVPDRQRRWCAAVRRARVPARPDLVYATGGPWTSLLAGEELARRFAVPFVADFRDPWTRNPSRVTSASALMRARRLERRICRRATSVVANTEQLRDQFASDYPEMADKFVTITNGFGSTAASLPGAARTADGPLEIAHFGTVYGERNPLPLLQAVDRLHKSGRLRPGQLRLRFLGAWQVADPECNRLAADLQAAGLMTREAPVPHAACMSMMQQSDVLLALQPGYPLQVPAKIYEYISTRRPLLVVGGEGATAALVRSHALGRCCPNETSALEEVLVRLAGGEALPVPQAWQIDRFDYLQLTRQLANVFEHAILGGALEPSFSVV
jgi:hypothetical protein